MTRDADHAARASHAAQNTTSAGRRAKSADEPVLPPVSRDEVDVGWGDDPSARDEDWYRRERPPHHE